MNSPTIQVSATGAVELVTLFAPYGSSVRYGNPSVFRGYTGDGLSDLAGLDYASARWYDPTVGQFVSADTVMDGLNRYAYVHGNPETLTDPSGHGQCPSNNCGGGGSPPPPPGSTLKNLGYVDLCNPTYGFSNVCGIGDDFGWFDEFGDVTEITTINRNGTVSVTYQHGHMTAGDVHCDTTCQNKRAGQKQAGNNLGNLAKSFLSMFQIPAGMWALTPLGIAAIAGFLAGIGVMIGAAVSFFSTGGTDMLLAMMGFMNGGALMLHALVAMQAMANGTGSASFHLALLMATFWQILTVFVDIGVATILSGGALGVTSFNVLLGAKASLSITGLAIWNGSLALGDMGALVADIAGFLGLGPITSNN